MLNMSQLSNPMETELELELQSPAWALSVLPGCCPSALLAAWGQILFPHSSLSSSPALCCENITES